MGDKFSSMVLFIGRIAKQKDVVTLVKAAKKVISKRKDVLFMIIGAGPEYNNIKKMVKKLDLSENIIMPGKIDYREVKKYYSTADIFVTTSIYEGTCMTLHEAAICRLPIVATKFAGARDFIIDNENGLLAEIGDDEKIAENIEILVNNKSLSQKMGANGYERVKKEYSREQALEKYYQMFVKLDKLKEKYARY